MDKINFTYIEADRKEQDRLTWITDRAIRLRLQDKYTNKEVENMGMVILIKPIQNPYILDETNDILLIKSVKFTIYIYKDYKEIMKENSKFLARLYGGVDDNSIFLDNVESEFFTDDELNSIARDIYDPSWIAEIPKENYLQHYDQNPDGSLEIPPEY